MSAPAVSLATERTPRQSHLARYGLWQLRDYAINRGAPILLGFGMLGTLMLLPLLKGMHKQMDALPAKAMAKLAEQHGGPDGVRAWLVHDLSKGFLGGFTGLVVFWGALLAMQGLVSNDRRLGFYRFLFSKPVSPSRYYGQAFLLHSAGFLAVLTILGGLYGAYVEPVLSPNLYLVIAAVFLFYAGILFLMTTLVRLDWLLMAVLLFVARILWDQYEKSTSVFAKLLYLLPPIHRTSDVYNALFGGTALPWHTIEWIAAYGAVCLIAALAVLRTQRLAVS
jgi:hypothetical protein